MARRGFLAALFAVALALPASGSRTRGPASLPIVLDVGWYAAEGDPPGGIAAIDTLTFHRVDPLSDPAPHGVVRWYRIRVDLAGVSGTPLAFFAPAIRDADEAWLSGVRIGGTGAFPPAPEKANLVARLYPLPPSVVAAPGTKELVLRVWHGRREGTVFREAPRLDDFAALETTRRTRDQALAFFCGLAVAIAAVLYLFGAQTRAPEYPLFATFSLLLGVYALTIHSGWATSTLSRELPFRLSATTGALIGVLYLPALTRLARAQRPLLMRPAQLFFIAFAAFAAVVPDTEDAVFLARIHPWILVGAFLDLAVVLVRATSRESPRSFAIVFGHAFFFAGALLLAGVVPGVHPGVEAAVLPLALGYAILASTYLWAMSDQVTRFRLGALTDAGTRLWNRRALFEEITARIDASRGGASLGLIVIDLDHFKEWNDAMGHLAGDRLLLRVARALQDASRPGDLVARYGGDEFAVVLERVDAATANGIASRFHGAVTEAVLSESPRAKVTASVGVCVYVPTRHTNAAALFHDADRALYDAKDGGKNRVVVFAARSEASRWRSGELRPLKKSSGEIRKL